MGVHVDIKHELPYNYSLILVAYMCPAELAENTESFAVNYPWILVVARVGRKYFCEGILRRKIRR